MGPYLTSHCPQERPLSPREIPDSHPTNPQEMLRLVEFFIICLDPRVGALADYLSFIPVSSLFGPAQWFSALDAN